MLFCLDLSKCFGFWEPRRNPKPLSDSMFWELFFCLFSGWNKTTQTTVFSGHHSITKLFKSINNKQQETKQPVCFYVFLFPVSHFGSYSTDSCSFYFLRNLHLETLTRFSCWISLKKCCVSLWSVQFSGFQELPSPWSWWAHLS